MLGGFESAVQQYGNRVPQEHKVEFVQRPEVFEELKKWMETAILRLAAEGQTRLAQTFRDTLAAATGERPVAVTPPTEERRDGQDERGAPEPAGGQPQPLQAEIVVERGVVEEQETARGQTIPIISVRETRRSVSQRNIQGVRISVLREWSGEPNRGIPVMRSKFEAALRHIIGGGGGGGESSTVGKLTARCSVWVATPMMRSSSVMPLPRSLGSSFGIFWRSQSHVDFWGSLRRSKCQTAQRVALSDTLTAKLQRARTSEARALERRWGGRRKLNVLFGTVMTRLLAGESTRGVFLLSLLGWGSGPSLWPGRRELRNICLGRPSVGLLLC